MTNVISTPVWVVEMTLVAPRRLGPTSYPAAVDVPELGYGSRWALKNAQSSGADAKPAGLFTPLGY